jgi:hypothetical protein
MSGVNCVAGRESQAAHSYACQGKRKRGLHARPCRCSDAVTGARALGRHREHPGASVRSSHPAAARGAVTSLSTRRTAVPCARPAPPHLPRTAARPGTTHSRRAPHSPPDRHHGAPRARSSSPHTGRQAPSPRTPRPAVVSAQSAPDLVASHPAPGPSPHPARYRARRCRDRRTAAPTVAATFLVAAATSRPQPGPPAPVATGSRLPETPRHPRPTGPRRSAPAPTRRRPVPYSTRQKIYSGESRN